ncbi:NYN domain-containing protein [Chloroflexota bacterium]
MSLVALYIDVENLLDVAREAICSVIEKWPDEVPKPTSLRLYTRADQTELWQIWTTDRFPSLDVQVKGVQHFTIKGSKNSADIALALDALADLLQDRVSHVAVLSDDSDFTSLFLRIKTELGIKGNQSLPFTWFVTNRPDTVSPNLTDFLPSECIHMISCAPIQESKSKNKRTRTIKVSSTSEEEQIALRIIEDMPVGAFKSTDCREIIKINFPTHALVKAAGPLFGNQFGDKIWPKLEKYGVLLASPSRGPRKYEITEAAKNKILMGNPNI